MPADQATEFFTAGLQSLDRGDDAGAETFFRQTLELRPQSIPTLSNLAFVLSRQGRSKEALECAERAAAIKSDDPGVLTIVVKCLAQEKRFSDVIAVCDKILAIVPGAAEIHSDRGLALKECGRFDDAIAGYRQALRLAPNLLAGHLNLGALFNHLGRHGEALASYDQAVRTAKDHPDAMLGRANALLGLRRHDEALAAYRLAARFPSVSAGAWLGEGSIHLELLRYEEALASFKKAYELNQGLKFLEALVAAKMHLCDWTDIASPRAAIMSAAAAGTHSVQPLLMLTLTPSPEDQLRCARLASAAYGEGPPASSSSISSPRRIRLAYLSADMNSHAVAFLTAGVLEQHDRSAFEVFVFSYGPDQPDPMRDRLKSAVEHFIDVGADSDDLVATKLRDLQIDIAVDLGGHTAGARQRVLARRPAAVQVAYLGFPGTSGASYIDYILADRYVVPEDMRPHYSEKVVYLPDVFQPNDDKRPQPISAPSRAAEGLPDDAFVFCSFNQTSKLTPELFDVWMRLLRNVDRSVLWVLAANPTAHSNIQREAAACGVSADRIVGAPRTNYEAYLARYRLADLFLDSYPFNAGTTASDALWMGLPIVTCSGQSFASRMAGSLLHAVGLTELVTTSLPEYEALALDLARDRKRLSSIKDDLVRKRGYAALFNTVRMTRSLESAYRSMVKRQRSGRPCESFAVAPSTTEVRANQTGAALK